jgi:murein L,D-transpeptidase YafK
VPAVAPATAPKPAAASEVVAPATPVSAPVEAPKPVVTASIPSADPGAEILSSTKAWAAAWAAKNSKKYLAFYASDFKTPGGESRSAWEAQRKQHIAAPKSIHIELRDTKVKMVDDKHASISFQQYYRAPHLNVMSRKTLNWVKTDGQWLIAEERSGK